MSVRVNLLPAESRQRARVARQRGYLIGASLGVLAVLAAVQVGAMNNVRAAETALAAEQTRTASLQSDVGDLHEFQELQHRQEEADVVIQTLLGDEYTLAGVLQDVAAAMPEDTQLDTLSVTTVAPAPGAEDADTAAATFSATGRTLASHAPGVERFLIGMEQYATFRHLYMTSSTSNGAEDEHATYTLEGDVSPMARTSRYEAGLPEALR
jgi:Tfp pilus assembly protein PilN